MTGEPFQRDPAAIDLSPLDPTLDPAFQTRAAAVARAAMAARASGLERLPPASLVAMTRWTRPVLAAAAAIVLIAFSVLERARVTSQSPTAPSASVAAERLGMPASIVSLAASSRVPTPADIVAAFDQSWIGGQ